MSIFNKVIPWFIPTKDDQRRWYTEELSDTPRELGRLLREFQDLSEVYNRQLGDFEANLSKHPLYEQYINLKILAQKVSFLWDRVEYKTKRENELRNLLKEL